MADKTSKFNRKRDDLATIVASIHGCSPDLVRKVRNGERDNEAILTTLMELTEGKTKLIAEVKRLIPFDKATVKRPKTTLKDLENRNK